MALRKRMETSFSGPLKNVALRWRNAMYRSDFARDADENRLIVSYSLPIW